MYQVSFKLNAADSKNSSIVVSNNFLHTWSEKLSFMLQDTSLLFHICFWYTNADVKILQYIRLHIKNSITQTAHYNTFYVWDMRTLDHAKRLFTKHIEIIEYYKK